MRILHVSDSYLPRLGGIELHLRDLVAAQRAAGHTVTVVTGSSHLDAEPVDGGVLRVGSLRGRDIVDLAPDVVHTHLSVVSPLALSTAVRASALGIPTVATVHSLWTDVARVAPLVRAGLHLRHRPIVWTAVSERAAGDVRRVVDRPVEVVPNAVDVGFWRSTPRPVSSSPPTILSVMRLTTVKRTLPLARMLRRVAATTDASAVIIGDGPRRGALEAYLGRHRLNDRIRLTGALDRTAVRDAMASASLFLAPAQRESFGIAALEARSAGLPVVARADSGVASFIAHGHEGLLASEDDELAAHAIQLVVDSELRERITHHNRTVPPMHTWAAALANNDRAYELADAVARDGRARVRRLQVVTG